MFDVIRRYWIIVLLACSCLLAGSMATQAQARKGWEYKRFFLMTDGTKQIDEEQVTGNAVNILNTMGSQGWELVSMDSSSNPRGPEWSGLTTQYTYVFKRPK